MTPYGLGHCYLVDDCVGMSYTGGDLFAGLVQESLGVGQFALFFDGRGGDVLRVLRVVDDDGADARRIWHRPEVGSGVDMAVDRLPRWVRVALPAGRAAMARLGHLRLAYVLTAS